MKIYRIYILIGLILFLLPIKGMAEPDWIRDTNSVTQAWNWLEYRQLSKAQQAFDSLIKQPDLSKSDSILITLGQASLALEYGAYLSAASFLKKADEMSSDLPLTIQLLYRQQQISTAIHLHRHTEAQMLLDRHAPLFTKSKRLSSYHELFALLLTQMNQLPEAMTYYEKAQQEAILETDTIQYINIVNKKGSLLLRQNLPDSSRLLFKKAFKLATQHPKTHAYAIHVLNNLGLTFTRTGNYNKARELHRQALTLTDTSSFPEGSIESYLLMAHSYSSQNQYDSSITVYHKALRIAENRNLNTNKAHIYKNMGLIHQKMGNHKRARYYFTEAQNLYETLQYQLPIAELTRLTGNLYLSQNRYVEALEYYMQALQRYQKYDYHPGAAEIYLNLGLVFDNIHNYQKALTYYEKGWALQKNYADRESMAYATQLIGNTLLKMGRIQEAISKYEASVAFREELGEPLSLASSVQSLGNAHVELANYEVAITYHQRALELRNKHNDISGQAYSYNSLGNIALKQNQPKQALEHYKRAMELAVKVDNLFIYGLTSRKIGELHLADGDIHLGLGYINNSLQTGEQIQHAVMQEKALEDLYNFYNDKGKTKQAFRYYLRYDRIRDSLARISSQQRITEIQMNYELEQKNLELTQANEQVDLLQKTNKQQQILLKRKNQLQYLMFATSLLLLAIVILIYFQWKQKRKHNRVLSLQNAKTEEINRELRVSQEALSSTNATKDKFFSIIAHDLRNPFMALYGLTDQLISQQQQLSKEEIIEHLSLVKNASEQLLDLLENLLYWSRTQRGKIIFTPSQLPISALLSEAIKLQKLTAQNKDITLHSEITCKNNTLIGDEDMLKTVLRNLLSNAIKFSHPGSEVRITASETAEAFVFQVIDQGIGMSPQKVDSLFQLEQNSSTGTANEHGTGLGLVLCREFVDKHNGKIWAESVENHGTIITFTIPKTKSYAP
ncbi:MAG: tetratricopeptide repeat protein [Bacteroidota bacterium]